MESYARENRGVTPNNVFNSLFFLIKNKTEVILYSKDFRNRPRQPRLKLPRSPSPAPSPPGAGGTPRARLLTRLLRNDRK